MNDERLDIIFSVLKRMKEISPSSGFIESLYVQYCERGSLSKAQLAGLLDKASSSNKINPSHLATLQAIILRKKSFHRSPKVQDINLTPTDNSPQMLTEILKAYPEHKRALFLAEKLKCGKGLQPAEKADITRLHNLLLNKKP